MTHKSKDSTLITTLLIVILIGVVGMTAKEVVSYYNSPQYMVNQYIKWLNQKDYKKLYSLIDQESKIKVGGRQAVIDYYKRIYEKENKLITVNKETCKNGIFNVVYCYPNHEEHGKLHLVNKKGKWYVKFPFEMNEVEVFAPYGAEVYLDSKKMTYDNTYRLYKVDKILPGNYLLKIEVAQEGYAPYYKMLRIPEERNYVAPYKMAYVKVKTAPHMIVALNDYSKVCEKSKVEFDDLLAGNYQITVKDQGGYLLPQEHKVKVENGDNVFKVDRFELSESGKKQFKVFLKSFYNEYIEAIDRHDANLLCSVFSGANKWDQIKLFNDWYVEKKDIIDAHINVSVDDIKVNDKGMIEGNITEEALLHNKEYDELQECDIVKQYKVILTLKTTIDLSAEKWKVTDREMLQSIVAVKDSKGRWIQY